MLNRLVEEAYSTEPNVTETGSGTITSDDVTGSAKEGTGSAREVVVTAEVTETGEASREEKSGDGEIVMVQRSTSQAAESEITVNVDDLLEGGDSEVEEQGREGETVEKQEGTAANKSNAPIANSVQDILVDEDRTLLSPSTNTEGD